MLVIPVRMICTFVSTELDTVADAVEIVALVAWLTATDVDVDALLVVSSVV